MLAIASTRQNVAFENVPVRPALRHSVITMVDMVDVTLAQAQARVMASGGADQKVGREAAYDIVRGSEPEKRRALRGRLAIRRGPACAQSYPLWEQPDI